jgi:ABC-2 type transport system permease protein
MSSVEGSRRKGRIKAWWEEKKVQLLCRSNMEKAFFRFITNMLSSERKLKLQIYPSMMMSIIFPLIMLISTFSMRGSFSQSINNLSSSNVYFFMYFSAIFNATYVSVITRSESYKAAWIYRAAPIHKPSDIYRAGVKAVIVKFSIPVLVLQSVIFIALCGIRILPNMIVILINMFLITLLCLYINKKELPFSKEALVVNQGQTGKSLLNLAIIAVIGIIHFALSHFTYGTLIFGVLCTSALILMWKFTFNFGWNGVEL